MPDKDVEEYLADRLWARQIAHGNNERRFLRTLPPGSRAFLITWLIESEVGNGGFHQLFWNGYGDIAALGPAAFEYFGANEHAAIVREALFVRKKEHLLMESLKLAGGLPFLELRVFSWSYSMTKLEPVDEKFYDLAGVLSPLRIKSIRSDPGLFVLGVK